MSYKETLIKTNVHLIALSELSNDNSFVSTKDIVNHTGTYVQLATSELNDFAKIGIVEKGNSKVINYWRFAKQQPKSTKRQITDNDLDAIRYLSKRGETDVYISKITGIRRQLVNKLKQAT